VTPTERSLRVRELARAAGFDAVGIAGVQTLRGGPEGERFLRWLEHGRQGEMAYLERASHRRLDPGQILPGCRSIVCLALNHGDPMGEAPSPAGTGRFARYARGRDYHKIFSSSLKKLELRLREELSANSRRYVDTGPVLEKLWAERAGLGWRGKHTNLVSRSWGSWLLLGEVLLDVELEADQPESDHCGSCTRCIEVCPTRAIPAPYELDARRCISYLTIEHRGPIPEELRPLMGDHVFGCDDCLEVCPWNRFARTAREAGFKPRPPVVGSLLTELVTMDETEFRSRFEGTAVMRAGRDGLARNACVALGNVGGEGAVDALAKALNDASPLVREHAAWALARLGGKTATPRVSSPGNPNP
jgi:epoxyqueuosine reductase